MEVLECKGNKTVLSFIATEEFSSSKMLFRKSNVAVVLIKDYCEESSIY